MVPCCSNTVFAVFNIITLLLGAAVLTAGIYTGATHQAAAADCERLLLTPALILASLAGLAGACCRASALLWLYLFLMGILILAALCFAAF